jgi:hypothetical protein
MSDLINGVLGLLLILVLAVGLVLGLAGIFLFVWANIIMAGLVLGVTVFVLGLVKLWEWGTSWRRRK